MPCHAMPCHLIKCISIGLQLSGFTYDIHILFDLHVSCNSGNNIVYSYTFCLCLIIDFRWERNKWGTATIVSMKCHFDTLKTASQMYKSYEFSPSFWMQSCCNFFWSFYGEQRVIELNRQVSLLSPYCASWIFNIIDMYSFWYIVHDYLFIWINQRYQFKYFSNPTKTRTLYFRKYHTWFDKSTTFAPFCSLKFDGFGCHILENSVTIFVKQKKCHYIGVCVVSFQKLQHCLLWILIIIIIMRIPLNNNK